MSLTEDHLRRLARTAIARDLAFVELVGLVELDPDTAFRDAVLRGDMRRQNLKGFNFKGASFIDCDFTGAKLNGCCLRGADLSRARGISLSMIKEADYDATTLWPEVLRLRIKKNPPEVRLSNTHGDVNSWYEEFDIVLADTNQLREEHQDLLNQIYREEKIYREARRIGDSSVFRDNAHCHCLLLSHRRTGMKIGTVTVTLASRDSDLKNPSISRLSAFGEALKLPTHKVAEISHFAISKQRRSICNAGRMARLGLMHGILQISAEYDITHLVGMMESGFHNILKRDGINAHVMAQFPATDNVIGEPVFIEIVPELIEMRAVRPNLWKALTFSGMLWPASRQERHAGEKSSYRYHNVGQMFWPELGQTLSDEHPARSRNDHEQASEETLPLDFELLSIKDIRTRFSEVLSMVYYGGKHIGISHRGEISAVLVSPTFVRLPPITDHILSNVVRDNLSRIVDQVKDTGINIAIMRRKRTIAVMQPEGAYKSTITSATRAQEEEF